MALLSLVILVVALSLFMCAVDLGGDYNPVGAVFCGILSLVFTAWFITLAFRTIQIAFGI